MDENEELAEPSFSYNENEELDETSVSGIETEELSEPSAGMIFDSDTEASLYYSKYAKRTGFGAAIRTSKKIKGVLRNLTLGCSRGGKARIRSKNPTKLPRPQTKVDCPARLNLVKTSEGKWMVSSVNLEHNHECTPGKNKFYKRNRIVSEHVERKPELNDKAGIRLCKTSEPLQTEAGGYENLPNYETDLRNYRNNLRRLKLVGGDAYAMHEFFMEMYADNPEFFYAMDLSEDGNLRNVFWADARSRAACKEFGDVVTFDTRYLVNTYQLPFVSFVGVNHHGQAVLLGCGIISYGDTETFSWLFNTWKICMWGCAPQAIITNQCMAMKNAIAEVWPETRHRWCIWHILKKVPEKLSRCNGYESLKNVLPHVVYSALSIEEFEIGWNAMIKEYGLEENDWLNGLYAEKNRWVLIFLKDFFWAGMSSTQRSESVNSYFDAYVDTTTTLEQFVQQYKNVLASKVENEENEDIKSSQSFIPTIADDDLERQFQSVYTNAKAREFQEQYLRKLRCTFHERRGDDSGNNLKVFEVFDGITSGDGEFKRKKDVCYLVEYNNETNEAKCNCRLFEFRGMVCTHQLIVWGYMRVKNAPEKYVLRRWRKDVKRAHTSVRINYANNSNTIETYRRDCYHREIDEAMEFIEGDQECFDEAMQSIRAQKQKWRQKRARTQSSGTATNFCSVGNVVITPKEHIHP